MGYRGGNMGIPIGFTDLILVDGRFQTRHSNGCVSYPEVQIERDSIRVGCFRASMEAVRKLMESAEGFLQHQDCDRVKEAE